MNMTVLLFKWPVLLNGTCFQFTIFTLGYDNWPPQASYMGVVSICSSEFGNNLTGYCRIISSLLKFFKGGSWKRGCFNMHISTYLAKIERLLLLEGMRP